MCRIAEKIINVRFNEVILFIMYKLFPLSSTKLLFSFDGNSSSLATRIANIPSFTSLKTTIVSVAVNVVIRSMIKSFALTLKLKVVCSFSKTLLSGLTHVAVAESDAVLPFVFLSEIF